MAKIYLCSPKIYEGVEPLPMIKFKRVANSLNLDNYDTLMFSSKQAIKFTEELNPSWKSRKILAVGEATKSYAKSLGANDIYFPKNYYGKELAKDVVEFFRDRKILYIRPKVISFDSKSYLKKFNIDIDEAIIYETGCVDYDKNSTTIEKNSIIIFTSPSTIECFFRNFEWDREFRAVVIGESTLSKLPNIVEGVYVSDRATIKDCISKALEIGKNLKKV